jgi:SAM-dependent methyltransferase
MTSIATTPLQKVTLSPEPLYRLMFGQPVTQILLTAWDLKLFDSLADTPLSLEIICTQHQLPTHSAEMLLNTCVALGLLQKTELGYQNSLLSQEYLVSHRPFYLGGLLEHFRAHVYPAWTRLKEAVLEDGPQMTLESGGAKTDIFQATQQLDKNTEMFISAMHNLSVSDGLVLAENFDFFPYRRLLDVGGGSGALSLAVASRFPALKAVVLDRPQVCALADSYIDAADLSGRVSTYPGDIFKDPIPEDVDVILLSLFIHAFGLERSTPILKKCFDALPPGGCLLIYEPMLDPNRVGPMMTLLSSLNMLVVTPSGGDVTARDYQNWLAKAGFEFLFYKPTPSIRHLVGGYKPR